VQVRAESGQPHARKLADRQDELHRLIGRDAEPLEPDVDLHVDVRRRNVVARSGGAVVGASGVEVGERRRQPGGDDLGGGLGQRVRIDEDRQREAGTSQPNPVREIGDAECVGAVLRERAAHLEAAEPVGVGLHDGEDFARRADEPAHRAKVRHRGVEVDLEPGRTDERRQRGVYLTPEMGATTSL
jgi:hypothetical protein